MFKQIESAGAEEAEEAQESHSELRLASRPTPRLTPICQLCCFVCCVCVCCCCCGCKQVIIMIILLLMNTLGETLVSKHAGARHLGSSSHGLCYLAVAWVSSRPSIGTAPGSQVEGANHAPGSQPDGPNLFVLFLVLYMCLLSLSLFLWPNFDRVSASGATLRRLVRRQLLDDFEASAGIARGTGSPRASRSGREFGQLSGYACSLPTSASSGESVIKLGHV